MPLYVVLAGVGRRIVHQFEIELAALQIGPLDANTHGIAQGEDPSFAASIDLVAVLVELVEVVLHFPQRNHAFDVGFVQLDVHAPVAHARDMAVEELADLVLHELHHLYLIEARSASAAITSRSEACTQSFSKVSRSADLPPSR